MQFAYSSHIFPCPYPYAPRSVGSFPGLYPRHPTLAATGTVEAAGPETLAATLFIKGDTNLTWVGYCDLWIHGYDLASVPVNLAITGGGLLVEKSMPLFMAQYYTDTSNFVKLFIKGAGLNPGFFPLATPVNLYVERGNTWGITLFIGSNQPSGSMPLFISALPTTTNQTDLFIAGSGGTPTGTVDLAIPYAADFTQKTGSIVLVMPDVVGAPANTVKLYVGGW